MTDSIVRPAVDAASFASVFRGHAGGVAVITADVGVAPVGLTVTSVSSVSADPPLLMFSVSHQSSSFATVMAADTLVVHFLGEGQQHLAKLCATSGIDRFADTTLWDRLPTGEPYFVEAGRWIRGRVVNRVEAGTAVVTIVEALDVGGTEAEQRGDAQPPLVYHSRAWHTLGDHSRLG